MRPDLLDEALSRAVGRRHDYTAEEAAAFADAVFAAERVLADPTRDRNPNPGG